MPGAIFGAFLAAASEHMEDADAAVRANEPTWPATAAGELCRLVGVLARYCDDLAPCDAIEVLSRYDLRPWERAAIDAGAALNIAAGALHRAALEMASHPARETASLAAQDLAAAAADLEAGRDLLYTHLATDQDGRTIQRSEWAAAVTSVPVTRALANEVGQWALRLATFTTRLAGTSPARARPDRLGQGVPSSARAELAAASRWLQASGAAARRAGDVDPVRHADSELLCAIPTAGIAERRAPGPAGESVAELCDGIAISASRLRSAMRDSRDQARWSPAATAGGWQWMAQAAAVTSHLSEVTLRVLATRAGQLADPPASEARLVAAADVVIGMRAAWQQADRAWDVMITESRMAPTRAMPDAGDLVIRMGRLAWDDPQWTPARSRHAQHRNPAALAPERGTVAVVVAAIHESADALACLAKADMNAVDAAGRAGRLYVPTRSLPEGYNVPRPFATAPASRCQALHGAYRVAVDASIQAARVLDELAISADAPSAVLALARAAAPAQSRRRGSRPRAGGRLPGDPTLDGTPFRHSRIATGMPGPVEEALRARHVHDAGMLMRAAAIDDAARQLMIQAETAPPAASPPDAPATRGSASKSARLAAQSFPRDPTTRPGADESPDPARRACSPGSRDRRRTP
jgi:hypothetical protein